jgi:hypothetical protein
MYDQGNYKEAISYLRDKSIHSNIVTMDGVIVAIDGEIRTSNGTSRSTWPCDRERDGSSSSGEDNKTYENINNEININNKMLINNNNELNKINSYINNKNIELNAIQLVYDNLLIQSSNTSNNLKKIKKSTNLPTTEEIETDKNILNNMKLNIINNTNKLKERLQEFTTTNDVDIDINSLISYTNNINNQSSLIEITSINICKIENEIHNCQQHITKNNIVSKRVKKDTRSVSCRSGGSEELIQRNETIIMGMSIYLSI